MTIKGNGILKQVTEMIITAFKKKRRIRRNNNIFSDIRSQKKAT